MHPTRYQLVTAIVTNVVDVIDRSQTALAAEVLKHNGNLGVGCNSDNKLLFGWATMAKDDDVGEEWLTDDDDDVGVVDDDDAARRR